MTSDQLAIRGGGFYQTPSQTGANTQYQGLSFPLGSMVGLALGGTYRIHFGPGSNALELSAGFEHIFIGTETYTGTGGIDARDVPWDRWFYRPLIRTLIRNQSGRRTLRPDVA